MSIQTIDPALATAIGSILGKFRLELDDKLKNFADSIPEDKSEEVKKALSQVFDNVQEKYTEILELVSGYRDEQRSLMDGVAGDISTLTGLLDLVESSADKSGERLDKFMEEAEEGMGALRSRIGALSDRLHEEGEGYRADLELIRGELQEAAENRGQEMREDLLAHIEEKVEWARLNADLWKEETKNKLNYIDVQLQATKRAAEKLEKLSAEKDGEVVRLKDELTTALKQRLKHRGPYKDYIKYNVGDCVMRDGATFWSVVDGNDQDPRIKSDTPVWRLLSMRGERGEKGDRGQRGPKGEKGRDGRDGVGIIELASKGLSLALATSDGRAIHVDLSDGVRAMIDERLKTAPDGGLK